ncbi:MULTISPECIES: hypothetical protein [Bacteroides]|jgi:hypothetical protein|uniref:hypothetical protein n=1 Tax=Bacteroides TaxID=816 RepID=UPI001D06857E|nr:hypothetical protein [Bacteroides cellulosilyticus]MCB6271707.1 hypothetical protein [Bacteroides cellulosilyticus]MCG4971787.1 hypothetical protein [Bacteroides cellulosilyticus]
MSKPIFKVEKTSYFEDDRNVLEDYTVYSHDKIVLFDAYREDIEELVRLLTLALNDRKEVKNER